MLEGTSFHHSFSITKEKIVLSDPADPTARLQGITKSISRYPTAKRRFDALVKALSEELARTMGGNQSANGSQVRKMKSGIVRMLSQRSLGKTTGIRGDDHEAQLTSDGLTS